MTDDGLEYDKDSGLFKEAHDEKTKYEKKFAKGGKMGYVRHFETLLDILTKRELKLVLEMFREYTDEFNLLTSSFRDITKDMDRFARSKFKRKLIDLFIIQEHRGRIMLNPHIFRPTTTKYNGIYRTQGLWTYLFENKDNYTEEIIFHEDDVFGIPDVLKDKMH